MHELKSLHFWDLQYSKADTIKSMVKIFTSNKYIYVCTCTKNGNIHLVLILNVCTVECKTAGMCIVILMAQCKEKIWPKTLLDSPLPQGEHSIVWTHQRSGPSFEWCLYSRICPECCATFSCPSRQSHDPRSYTRRSDNAGHHTEHPTANREKQLTSRIQYTNRNFFIFEKKNHILFSGQ